MHWIAEKLHQTRESMAIREPEYPATPLERETLRELLLTAADWICANDPYGEWRKMRRAEVHLLEGKRKN